MDILFSQVIQLAFGYWRAQALFLLAQFGIFDALNEGESDIAWLASRKGLTGETLERLLNAGVALKLLKRENALYQNSELAERFLVSSSPESLAHWVLLMGRWLRPWADMSEAIRVGDAVEDRARRLGEDVDYLKDFILGMHEYARRTSTEAASVMEIDGSGRLLDVGGGAGTYSIALCKREPALAATVLDLEPVLPIAQQIIQEYGLEDRIDVAVFDYTSDPFEDGVDYILASNILHQESPTTCRSLIERARFALDRHGKLVVHGHFLNNDRVSPLFATLHSLSSLALWSEGRSYTISEMKGMLEQGGFAAVSVREAPDNAVVFVAQP